MIAYNLEALAEMLVSMDKIKKHCVGNPELAKRYMVFVADKIQDLLETYATPEDVTTLCWGATNKLQKLEKEWTTNDRR